MTYYYCPNPKCGRKLFYGAIEALQGYLNFRCPRCHAECALGNTLARPQVFVSPSPDRPLYDALRLRSH